MVSQIDRVIAAASAFRGTCQADWISDPTPDNGPYITRVAARIEEAEQRGYAFEVIGTRSRTRVYRLLEVDSGRGLMAGDSAPVPSPAAPAMSPGTLFGVERVEGEVPHWRDWEAA